MPDTDDTSRQTFTKPSDDELIPDEPLDNLISGVKGGFSGIGRGVSGRFRRLGSWIGGRLVAFAGFLQSPVKNTKSLLVRTKNRTSGGIAKLRHEMDRLSWVQMSAVLIAFGIFLIAPLISVVVFSFVHNGEISLYHFASLLKDTTIWPLVYSPAHDTWVISIHLDTIFIEGDTMSIRGWDFGAIFNSIYVALIVTFLSVIIGIFMAFIVARYDFPGKKIVRTLLIFPILATPFVGAIGIQAFIGPYGILNNIFYETLHWIPYRMVLEGFTAMIFVQSLSFFALVYLNAYSSFMGVDPALEEQAENLGASGFKLFRSVTLPLAMPGIQAGAILTFILSIEDLGTPIVFFSSADNQTSKTLAYKVFNSIVNQAGTINPKGPALGIILLIFAFTGFLAIRKYASLRSYESGTKGGQWNPRIRRLSGRGTFLMYIILLPTLFLALIPQLGVIILSFAGAWGTSAILPEWTLANYIFLADYPDVVQSIYLTLAYGAVATIFIVILGTSAAYIIARKDIPGKTAFDLLVTSPIALPGIVIATGYFTLFYNTPFFLPGAPAFLLIMSYTVRKFPFTVRAAYAGLQSTPVMLEEAAQNVGASKNKTFTSITLPLIGVSVLAGSLLSFVYSVSEVSTSLILGSVGPEQAPMTYWTNEILAAQGGTNPAAGLGVLMMAMQMVVITITTKLLGTRSSAITGI